MTEPCARTVDAPYTFEFEEGSVREWRTTADGAESTIVEEYRPSLFVGGPDEELAALRAALTADPKVCETALERRYTDLHGWHDDERATVLRVDLERVGEVRTLATEIRTRHEREAHAPGTFRLYDVDLAPGFRYCLDRGIRPDPEPSERDLRTLEIGIDEFALAEGDVSDLRIGGDRVRGDPADVLWSLGRRLERDDPDVLVVSHADLVPALDGAAANAGIDEFHLGRLPGWRRIAGENAYESYGTVGHSPARYRVPGRAIVDESNGFLWHRSGIDGVAYMARRSGRPLQEASWGSIGTLLTARQVRLARERDVLAPWNKWEPERFKDVSTLHAADRGGFTFAPEVGVHEDVHEIDFASLYPRIIRRHNVSPETVGCECDAEAAGTVPELGYHVCEKPGFLPEALDGLLNDREECKRQLRSDLADDEAATLRAESGAIKWVLVSCFGYQGYRNAKFGRIECHEAINAYAREILLTAKAHLEDAGWRIVHGIVDSLWVTPRVADPEPLADVTATISRDVGIELERDGRYEWACFVPLRESNVDDGGAPAGALTRYFGKRTDGSFKYRGIEVRQRSTPEFVATCQREFVGVFDAERDPGAVCDRLGRRLGELRRGAIDPAALVITKRVSKPLSAYRQETRTVGALRRHEARGLARRSGQSVRYVVVDDDARRTRERVRLDAEIESAAGANYDADFYADLLVRACESVVSPLGWDRGRIRRHLADGRAVCLSAFDE